jgi:hypothetical protein
MIMSGLENVWVLGLGDKDWGCVALLAKPRQIRVSGARPIPMQTAQQESQDRKKGSGYWLGTNRFTAKSVSQAGDLAIMRGGFLY